MTDNQIKSLIIPRKTFIVKEKRIKYIFFSKNEIDKNKNYENPGNPEVSGKHSSSQENV